MSNAVMPIQDCVNACKKIREITGLADTIKSGELPDKITEVYTKGKNDEWSSFWDVFQQRGARTHYGYAFWNNWNDTTFRPKYDIRPTNAERMFAVATITDLKGILEECNVVLDTSKSTYMNHAFNNCYGLTYLPEISFESATYNNARIEGVFMGCYNLKSIDKVIYPTEIYLATTNTFQNCGSLKHLRIGGVVGNSFNISWCPLDAESTKDVILHLKNYAGTDREGTYTLTLKDNCKTALEADTETVELDGVSYTYFELITAKGWNLA